MVVRRALVLGIVFVAACGEDQGPTDGGTPMDGFVITGDPEITSFTSSKNTVAPFETVTLSWTTKNAHIIDISTEDGTLISTFEQNGNVVTSEIAETTEYTLTASNGQTEVTEKLTVGVDWPPPAIDSFIASPDPAFINSFATLQWTTRNATRSKLKRDGVEIAQIPLVPEMGQGFMNILVDSEEAHYELEVSNPEESVTQTLTLRATAFPEIFRFVVLPRVILGRTVTATISWNARGVSRTQLFVSGVERFDFPGTLTGTVALSIPGPADLRIIGFADNGGVAEQYRTINSPIGELEPNDDLPSAKDITYPGGVQASFTSPNDHDFYSLWVNFGADLRVITQGQLGGPCTVDTRILLRDINLTIIGDVTSGGGSTGRGGECAAIDPTRDVWARDLQFGMYFLEVMPENMDMGTYGLITDEIF